MFNSPLGCWASSTSCICSKRMFDDGYYMGNLVEELYSIPWGPFCIKIDRRTVCLPRSAAFKPDAVSTSLPEYPEMVLDKYSTRNPFYLLHLRMETAALCAARVVVASRTLQAQESTLVWYPWIRLVDICAAFIVLNSIENTTLPFHRLKFIHGFTPITFK